MYDLTMGNKPRALSFEPPRMAVIAFIECPSCGTKSIAVFSPVNLEGFCQCINQSCNARHGLTLLLPYTEGDKVHEMLKLATQSTHISMSIDWSQTQIVFSAPGGQSDSKPSH